jgi:small neutral amino acid transporter SnatA (MarC family)
MGRWSGRQLTSDMLSEPYVASLLLFLALLNPFMMSVYLIDLITDLRRELFVRVLLRGALISGAVFAVFAWSGDAIFSDVLQVRFASFQIFGGIVFLLIGARLRCARCAGSPSTSPAPSPCHSSSAPAR